MVRMLSKQPSTAEKMFALPGDDQEVTTANTPALSEEEIEQIIKKWESKPVGSGTRIDANKALQKLKVNGSNK